jgi:hypothetical protein
MSFEQIPLGELINLYSGSFADSIIESAKQANSEEDIKMAVEKEIYKLAEKTTIKLKPKYELPVEKGRVDAIYGRLFIEYKNPNSKSDCLSSNSNSSGNKKLIKQIKSRFKTIQDRLNYLPESLVGVGLDGKYFIFIKYLGNNQYNVSSALEVNSYNTKRFLKYLFNLGTYGKPFLPEYLARDFGAEGTVAKRGIKTLYEAICSTTNAKAETFFKQWKVLFGQVCGYDVNNTSDKVLELGKFYGIDEEPNIRGAELLFCVHSYYALFIKLLASEIVSFSDDYSSSFLKEILKASSSEKLLLEIQEIESGGIFRKIGIVNFLEGDLFSWYISIWDEKIAQLVRDMVEKLDEYNPATLSEDSAKSRDLLKKLYQQLFPKSLRHDLGEYYTPDWLAEYTLNQVNFNGDADQRLLDPSCGSGTFIVMIIAKIRDWYEKNIENINYDYKELLKRILNNVIGFDLNPLAVMAARTNYLVAIRDLIQYAERIEIPIYLCDSVMTPSEYGSGQLLTDTLIPVHEIGLSKEIKTAVGPFYIPTEVTTSFELISQYSELLEQCVKNNYQVNEFIDRCKNENLPIKICHIHENLYRQLLELENTNQNGIWSRIIKNAFAPIFIGKVNYIVGNPPWVSYDNLPENYREDMAEIWKQYQLFPQGGWRARFAKGNTELAMIFTYSCIDNYLEYGGKLGFVLTQSLFQSKAGEGYRRFEINKTKKINIECVYDLTSLQPFDGASTRTAILICSLDSRGTSYPIPYIIWRKKTKLSLSSHTLLSEIESKIIFDSKKAVPISNKQSPWMILPPDLNKETIEKIQQGQQEYRAWKGSDTRGGNGLFWLKPLQKLSNSLILCHNLPEFSRKEIKKETHRFEKDLIYPLLRGKEVSRWQAKPEYFILYPHVNNSAIPELELKVQYPQTYSYLQKMRTYLEKRKMYDLSRRELEFYALFETGDFLTKPYKVVWKYICSELCCAVLSSYNHPTIGEKVVIPDNKLVIIPFEDEVEAHYVCSCLNSSIARCVASTYIVSTQISTHILEHIHVPKFKINNELHSQLADLSWQCHIEAENRNTVAIEILEKKIDQLTAKLWEVTDEELESIQLVLLRDKEVYKGEKIIVSDDDED